MAETTIWSADERATDRDLASWRPAAGALAGYFALIAAGWWTLFHRVPDTVALHLGGGVLTLAHVRMRVIGNAAAILTVLPIALALEWAAVGWRRASLRRLLLARSPSMKTDLAMMTLGLVEVLDLVGRVMMLGVSLISGTAIHEWLAARGLALNLEGVPWLLQVVLFFCLFTFLDYWTHRIDHTHLFWPLHRFHHSAEEFAVVTAARQHPAVPLAVLAFNLPLAALGAPADVLLWVNLIISLEGFLIHSEITSDWGWFGRWVLQSPLHHRLHHKLSMDTPTGHFSTMPLWDHLFGTWTGGDRPDMPIGVAAPYRHGYWIGPDLLRDYWDFWRGVIGRRPRD